MFHEDLIRKRLFDDTIVLVARQGRPALNLKAAGGRGSRLAADRRRIEDRRRPTAMFHMRDQEISGSRRQPIIKRSL